MKRTAILEAIIFLYTALFIYTGISKIIDYNEFEASIADSPILAPMAGFIAWAVPVTEFIITLLLIIPRWRLKGLYASLALMTVFTLYIVALLTIDDTLPCSCGGIIQQLSWPQHLVFNSIFIILASWAIVLQRREKKQNQLKWSRNNRNLLASI